MKSQFGVCKNKVGCSLAYTGEKVPLPSDLKCPECGQALVVENSKPGGTKAIIMVILLLLLVMAGAGVAALVFKDKILDLVFHKPAIVQQLPSPSPEDSGIRPIQSPDQTSNAAQSNTSASTSTSDSPASNTDKSSKVVSTPAQPSSPQLDVTVQDKPKTPPDQNQPPNPTPSDKTSQARTES
jgi:hypothetical protein